MVRKSTWSSIALLLVLPLGCALDTDPDVPDDEGPETASVAQDLIANPDSASLAAPGDYDGDGGTDISVKGSNGIWYIDFQANGFGGRWDAAYPGYGGAAATPVPADYDGDGLTDISIKDTSGFWGIDYAWNGFGSFDQFLFGYGFADAVPVPADYDGDGLADLSIKDAGGLWAVDWAADGFHGWNDPVGGYGDASWVPVPGKYDSDTKADRAIKNASGQWFIDDSSNGWGKKLCGFCPVTRWDHTYSGYGNGSAIPNAADYDNDGHADLSVTGLNWYIDLWAPSYSFGAWDYPNTGYPGHFAASMKAVPGDYDGDLQTDLAWKDNATGQWFIDYQANGFKTTAPYHDVVVGTTARPMYDPAAPYIYETRIYDPNGNQLVTNGAATLTIGVRYNVLAVVQPGSNDYNAGVEANPALGIPRALNFENQTVEGAAGLILGQSCSSHAQCNAGDQLAAHECNLATGRCNTHRWFSITCSEAGSFPLGFQMRDAYPLDEPWGGTGNAFNPDYGIRVLCAAPATGLSGRVTQRTLSGGVYKPGTSGIDGVTVSIPGFPVVTTSGGGNWSMPGITGGPHRVTFNPPSGSQLSGAVAVNVRVPAGQGTRVDVSMEKKFTLPTGSSYTTFIDYSRGRTVFHTVDVATQFASVKTELAPKNGDGLNKTQVQVASQFGAGARVVLNGSYFIPAGPVGYFASATSAPDTMSYVPSWVPDGGPGRMYPTDAPAQSPRITLERPRYGSGFEIPVSFEGLSGASDERIALAPVGAPLSTVTALVPSSGKRGAHAFASVPPGTYVARVLRNNNTQLTAQSATFGVGRSGGEVRVTTDSMYFSPAGNLVVSYRGIPFGGGQVSIAPAGSSTAGPPVGGVPAGAGSGNLVLPVPTTAGLYEARAWVNGSLVGASNTFTVAAPMEPLLQAPLLAITGTGITQNVRIVQNTPSNFFSNVDPWTLFGGLIALYDTAPRDNVNDISFGFQCWPMLLGNGKVIASEHPDTFRFDPAWARTGAGVNGSHLFLVIADGEGIHGRHGATFNQMGEFFRDSLFVTDAMNFDGGLSTLMVLWDATTNQPRAINTITGEDGRIQTNPHTAAIQSTPGAYGSVDNILRVGQ
jgi:hypothetical protein